MTPTIVLVHGLWLGSTLREAALATGYVTAADFDRIVTPTAMVGQPQPGS